MGRVEGVAGAVGSQVIRAAGDTVTIPDAHLLFSGDFSRSGADLVITGDGRSVVVADYFGDAGMPTLAAPNGAVLLPDVVSALAGPLAAGQYAQAGDGEPAAGIGSVVSLTGSATAQRSDGTVVELAVDSRLAEGDVVQTGSGSALGIVFDDGAVFNLNADSRMVLNELVYEPGGGDNSMLFSLVQGVFAFVAGQVAPTGEMRIDTPAATMGIRGTSGIVKLETIDGVAVFRVVPDPVTNEVGTIVLYSPGTDIILVVMESSDSQWAIDAATGQVIEQPADPGDADLIEQLHQTYIDFAGIPDDPGDTQLAETGGSGLPTQFSPTPAEIAAIIALAGGALPQEEALAGEPVVSGLDAGGEPESGEADPPPPPPPAPEPGSSDPQQQPGGFTGDNVGNVDEDGSSTTTGQLVFDGGTGLVQPLVIQGTYGTFEIDADGTWVYTLDNESEAVQALGQGDTAEESFAVVSGDGSETKFVTITVEGVNDVPTVTGTTTGAVAADGTQVATGTVTVDDPDAGESSVQPQSNVQGTYGTFSILADGNWTYSLDGADPAVQALAEGETVSDSFTVTSADGTVTETVTVTVTGANDVPTLSGTTTGEVMEDGAQLATGTIAVADPDAGESSVQPQTEVAGTYGTFSILADGNWTYTLANADPAVQGLAEGETVNDSFAVTSFDGTAEETVTVTVTGENDTPVARNDGVTTDEDTAVEGDLLADNGDGPDEDVDGDPLTITHVNGVTANVGTQIVLASGALLLVNADGSFAYDPNGQFEALGSGDTAEDSFTYTLADGQGGSDTATVTLTINGVNDAPLATDSLIATNEGVAAEGALTGSDTDDGTTTYSLEQAPQNGTLLHDAEGNYVYTPDEGFTGLDSFTFRVTDAEGAFNLATVAIDVAPLNAETGKIIVGSDGNDVLIGSALDDDLSGGLGNDVLRSGGAPQTFFGLDLLDGGPGDDRLVAEGGAAILVGGSGNDELTREVTGQHYDWVRADYQTSPAGIVANLTGAALGDLAPGEVADGFGTVDQLSNMHVIGDSAHNDVIHVDETYSNGDGNAIEVRLSGGDDAVAFDNVAHARIGYNQAGGGVLADLEAGTATDLDAGDNFIGNDTFTGKVHVLRGSHFNDELYGSSGDEAFRGEGGDDYIDGRGGSNTIQFVSSSEGVHVDLSQNLVLNDGIFIDALGRHGSDTLLDIQNVTGSDWGDLIIGDAGNNRLFGGLGNDELRSGGAPQTFFGEDRLFGGAGDDRLIAEGGWVVLEGGAGNDEITSTDTGGFWDFVRADYGSSLAGIVANLTIGSLNDLAPGEVADGFGTVDQVSNVHLIADSQHDDLIHVDDSYANSFGNWIEVRLSGGNDTVVFDNVGTARISYSQALGPVLLDMEAEAAKDKPVDYDPAVDSFGDVVSSGEFIGNDTFTGATEARGSRHDDVLYGRFEGNDSLRGSGGDDYIDGRGGSDTITFGDSASGIHVDLSQSPENRVISDGIWIDSLGRHGRDEVHSIENVSGTPWADIIIGDDGNNHLRSGGTPEDFFAGDHLDGRGGDDVLTVQFGAAVLVGGPGNDVLESNDSGGYYDWVRADYRTSTNGIVANLTENFIDDLAPGQVADGFGTTDTLWGMHVLADSPNDDVIHVDWSYQSSIGNWIEVRLSGGNDTVTFNGVHHARISYQQALGPVLLDMDLGQAKDKPVGYDPAVDSFAGAEAAANHIGEDSFSGANAARGSSFGDVLLGRTEGDDVIRGSGGDDYIDGRGGTNQITFGDSESGIHVDLSRNAETRVLNDGIWIDAAGRHGIDEVHNVQNVQGSDWDDLIIGDAGNNELSGGRGDDVLRSGGAPQDFGGFDFLNGDLGNDTLIAEGGFTRLRGGPGDDVLTSTDAGGHWDFVIADYRGSPGAIVANLTGGTIGGLAPGEVSDGFGSVDHVSKVHVLADTPFDDVVHVDSSYSTSAGNWIEVRLTGGDDQVTFTGMDFARISYSYADGPVLIDLEAGTATDLGEAITVGSDTFTGATAARGSGFDDTILGRVDGNDDLRGWAGNDYIDGRGGINTISFAGAEFGIQVDLSQAPESRVLNDGHWNSATESPGVDEVHNVHNVIGSEWDDQIIGDANDNVLRGGLGDDSLAGGSGNDTLIGGPGEDSMNGGAGVDRFGFRAPDEGVDSIIDFGVSEDVLVIDASVFGGGLAAGQGLSPDQFVSGSGPQPTAAHGQFLYDSVLGELSWDVDGTGAEEAVHFATLAGAPNLTEQHFELIDAGGSFLASSEVAAALDGGAEPVA